MLLKKLMHGMVRKEMQIVEQSQNEDKVDPDSLVEEDIASATPKITEIKKKKPVISKAQAAKEARNKLTAAAMSEEPQKVLSA
jgi:exoribonuclease II